MSKNEIIAELPSLRPADLAEIQAKLDEIIGDVWLDRGELTDSDKTALDAALAQYRAAPNAGSPWAEVRRAFRRDCTPEGL